MQIKNTLIDGVSPFVVISRGKESGSYQAFSDACRLHNGDIAVVFYAGYAHVSYPNEEYPTGGKICMVRSSDEGRTWTQPEVIYDDEYDNRDSHIAQLSDGTIIVSFFNLRRAPELECGYQSLGSPKLIRSLDGGKTWDKEHFSIDTGGERYACSAPVRELADGTCILPVYHEGDDGGWGGVVHSYDGGKTWGKIIDIGRDSEVYLPAETDIVQLKDGSLYAALRAVHEDGTHMHFSCSSDLGLTWSAVQDIGFFGHAPHFTRLSSGAIVLTHRGFTSPSWETAHTALRVSFDEARTWSEAYVVDSCIGAYASTVELEDGSILVAYYSEGENSAVRVCRLTIEN